jgi:hypothetical protein
MKIIKEYNMIMILISQNFVDHRKHKFALLSSRLNINEHSEL